MASDYSIKEIAIASKIHPATVRDWIHRKLLKATLRKNRYLVKRKDLKEFFDNPPNNRTRGLVHLLDRDFLKSLKNE